MRTSVVGWIVLPTSIQVFLREPLLSSPLAVAASMNHARIYERRHCCPPKHPHHLPSSRLGQRREKVRILLPIRTCAPLCQSLPILTSPFRICPSEYFNGAAIITRSS